MFPRQILHEMIGKNLVPYIVTYAKNRSRRMIRGYAIIATWQDDIEVSRIQIAT